MEQIQCNGNSAAVTFINASDAQKFYDDTPNGIVFRRTSDVLHYAETRMAQDVTPLSSLVMHYVDVGITRCVSAIGVDIGMSLEHLKAVGSGRLSPRGQLPRMLECLIDDMNAGGVSTLYKAHSFKH